MAMTLLPEKGKGQVMAVCLLVIALILFYFIGLHWFITGHLQVARELSDQQQNELRFSLEAQKVPALRARLEEVKAFAESNSYFLANKEWNAAAADLVSQVKDVVATKALDATRCQVLSSQPTRADTKEPYERVTVGIRMSCDLEDLVRILYALENSTPFLFVNELNLFPRVQFDSQMTVTGGNMEVRFDVSGYIRGGADASAAPAADAKAPEGK